MFPYTIQSEADYHGWCWWPNALALACNVAQRTGYVHKVRKMGTTWSIYATSRRIVG